jgi:Ca2+-binding RTX toxin-like protein
MAVLDYFGNPVKLSGSAPHAVGTSALANGAASGTSGNDIFSVGNGAYTLSGGAGDDTYVSVTSASKIVEAPDGGIDTVWVNSNYKMAANVENLFVGYAQSVIGNDSNNYMVGNASSQTIDGGKGNDVLTGGGGGDSFVLGSNSGYDVITDFHTGPSASATINPDTLRLTGYSHFTSLSDVKAAMTQVGADVVLQLDDHDAVKLLNTKIGDFTQDNVLLNYSPTNLKMTFDEEFSGPLSASGGGANTKFRTDYGWGGDSNAAIARTLASNGEKQLYVDPGFSGKSSTPLGLNPFSVNNGVLDIHAGATPAGLSDAAYGYKFTSGMLSTRDSFTQTYGYFEAKMELPAGSGAWPAFWLYTTGSSASELDVMESHSGDQWTATTHDHSTGKDTPLSSAIYTPDLSTGYHTYGVLWTADTVTWYLDGSAVRSEATPADMHGPMYMMVNLALDSSTSSNFSGADLKVDYLRAYSLDQLPANVSASPVEVPKTVTGGAGNDTLSDSSGANSMAGGGGNDTYYVSNAATKVVENAGAGTDTVYSSADYTLASNVEHLVLTGKAIQATGNELDNHLTGNDLDNMLVGNAGSDTLDGGKGADTMIGGTGNDTYYVDNIGDKVIEKSGEGTDFVVSSIDYTLADNVENMSLTGNAHHATGNSLDNTIYANDLGDVLDGGDGNDRLVSGKGIDTLIGGNGNDSFVVNNSKDVVIEKPNGGWDIVFTTVNYKAAANVEQITMQGTAKEAIANDQGMYIYGNNLGDKITGGLGSDHLKGGTGDDIITGGGGYDVLTGGGGHDTFIFTPGFGTDVITDFDVGNDKVDWSALMSKYGAPVLTDHGADVTATFGTNSITFQHLHASDLTSHHIFG